MNFRHLLFIGCCYGLSSAAQAAPTIQVSLRPSYGGAVVEGTLISPRPDTVLGVWSPEARARLMRCTPRCTVVDSLPVKKVLTFSADTVNRVALGGQYRGGQSVKLIFQLRTQGVVTVRTVVQRGPLGQQRPTVLTAGAQWRKWHKQD